MQLSVPISTSAEADIRRQFFKPFKPFKSFNRLPAANSFKKIVQNLQFNLLSSVVRPLTSDL
jgi:hypothetical protein